MSFAPGPHYPKHWLSIGLLILAILSAIALSDNTQTIERVMSGGGYTVNNSAALPASGQSMPTQASGIAPYPYGGSGVPATDTREFLKQSYNATMQTRDVQGLVRRTETTVRGFGGRVDQTSSQDKYGYVSFVIPASKFDEFRTEIESFVESRFLKVQVSSQNLLPQKQSIEEQQKQVQKNLDDLSASRTKLISSHKATVASLQSQIDANDRQLATLNAEVTNDPVRQQYIQNQKVDIASAQASLKSQLANENASYNANLASFDAQIKYANDSMTAVKTQDQNLLDNVATVDGTISFQWISIFEIVHTYLPGEMIPGIIALLALVAYFWERRRVSQAGSIN